MESPIPVAVPKAGPAPLPELAAYLAPFAPLFRRAQSRQSLERYVTGLLTDLPRKNGDTIAAAVAGTSTERLQHLLTDADWAPEALDAARVRQLVALSPPGGVLVLDDTGLPKKGTALGGGRPAVLRHPGQGGQLPGRGQRRVRRGRAGDQHAAALAGQRPPVPAGGLGRGHARRASGRMCPRRWSTRPSRSWALALVDRARAWGVPFAFVAADAGYGQTPAFLAGLEARGVPYACGGQAPVRLAPARRGPPRPRHGAPAAATRGGGGPALPRPAPLWDAETLLACLPERGLGARHLARGDQGRADQAVRRRAGAPRHRQPGRGNEQAAAWPTCWSPPAPCGWLLGERPLPGHPGRAQAVLPVAAGVAPGDAPGPPGQPWPTPAGPSSRPTRTPEGECGLGTTTRGRLARPAPPPRPRQARLHLPGVQHLAAPAPLRRARRPAGLLLGLAEPRPGSPTEFARRAPPGARLAPPGPRPLARRHRPDRHLPLPEKLTE